MKGYKKILIALNGSPAVLQSGLHVAEDEKCWVTVVKVLPDYDGDLNLVGVQKIEDVLDSGARTVSEQIKETAEARRLMVKTRVEQGNVSERIVEAAEEERCDLIVIGAPKKKNILRKIFGDNTVERVLDKAPCPVLVVGS